jgi:hypothetical protein
MSLPEIISNRGSDVAPWERLPGEPDRWYGRFVTWLNQQKHRRSILGAYNEEQAQAGKGRKKDVPGSWDLAITKYRWR